MHIIHLTVKTDLLTAKRSILAIVIFDTFFKFGLETVILVKIKSCRNAYAYSENQCVPQKLNEQCTKEYTLSTMYLSGNISR